MGGQLSREPHRSRGPGGVLTAPPGVLGSALWQGGCEGQSLGVFGWELRSLAISRISGERLQPGGRSWAPGGGRFFVQWGPGTQERHSAGSHFS